MLAMTAYLLFPVVGLLVLKFVDAREVKLAIEKEKMGGKKIPYRVFMRAYLKVM